MLAYDADADGDTDIAYATGYQVGVLLRDGDLWRQATTAPGYSEYAIRLSAADVDRDGVTDLTWAISRYLPSFPFYPGIPSYGTAFDINVGRLAINQNAPALVTSDFPSESRDDNGQVLYDRSMYPGTVSPLTLADLNADGAPEAIFGYKEALVGIVNNTRNRAPITGAFAISADTTKPGRWVTLRLPDAADPEARGGGRVALVRYYRDSDRSGTFDPSSDRLIATSTQAADDWAGRVRVDASWGLGVVRVFAVATDELGANSLPADRSVVVVNNQRPIVGSLSAGRAAGRVRAPVTLFARDVFDIDDEDAIARVELVVDVNGNGMRDRGDPVLAMNRRNQHWQRRVTIRPSWNLSGRVTFLAIATDIDGARSAAVRLDLPVS